MKCSAVICAVARDAGCACKNPCVGLSGKNLAPTCYSCSFLATRGITGHMPRRRAAEKNCDMVKLVCSFYLCLGWTTDGEEWLVGKNLFPVWTFDSYSCLGTQGVTCLCAPRRAQRRKISDMAKLVFICVLDGLW